MPGPADSRTPIAFGPFVLDRAAMTLERAGTAVPLAPKAFELLAYLAARAGQLAGKDELLDAVWGHQHLSDSVLKTVISELRAALGDDPKTPRWIHTVARRGYRFEGRAEARAEPAAATPRPGNLPAAAAPLWGRDAELAQLGAMLAEHALVSVCGPGGVGKTRLALAAAQRAAESFADGVWLVELAPLVAEGGAAALRGSIAEVLQLGAAAAASDAALAQAIAAQHALLLLDNAEHLLDTLAPLVQALRSRGGRARLLLTSQQPLNVEGEALLRLPPLAVPDESVRGADALIEHGAVRLFVERVAQRLPGFALAPHQQQAVAAICCALDGLPLALELAAACVPALGVHGLLERLQVDPGDRADEARLTLLTHGWRGVSPRQRSLREALHWSHELLTLPQQRLWRRLAVFQGCFTPQAAEAVCADAELPPAEVTGALLALVDKSLLVVATDAAGGAMRHRLLEGPREFALAQLRASGEHEALAMRHAAWMREHWTVQDSRCLFDPSHEALARQRPELDNLRAAWRWCAAHEARQALAAELAGLAALPMVRMGLALESHAWCEQARPWAEARADEALLVVLAMGRATLASMAMSYRPEDGLLDARRAAAWYRARGDAPREYRARYLENWLGLRGCPEVDRSAVQARMREIERADWGTLGRRWLRQSLLIEHRQQGRVAEYLEGCRHEYALLCGAGAITESWSIAQWLMLALNDAGRVDEAIDVGAAAMREIYAARRERQFFVLVALWLMMCAQQGNADRSGMSLAAALQRGARLQSALGMSWTLGSALAWLAWHEGRTDDAATLLAWGQAAEQRAGQSGGPFAQRTAAELRARLEASLAPEPLSAALARGAAMGEDEALAVAFGAPLSV